MTLEEDLRKDAEKELD